MDSWIFQTARKVCVIVFGADIFIHAVIGASTVSGFVKGTASMVIMLGLLVILSAQDLKRRVGKSRKSRKVKKKEGATNG